MTPWWLALLLATAAAPGSDTKEAQERAANSTLWQDIAKRPDAHKGERVRCHVESGGYGVRLARPDALKDRFAGAIDKRWTELACVAGLHDKVWVALYFRHGERARIEELGWQGEVELDIVGSYIEPPASATQVDIDPEGQPVVAAVLHAVRKRPEHRFATTPTPGTFAYAQFDETPWVGKRVECDLGGEPNAGVALAGDPWARGMGSADHRARYLAIACEGLGGIRVYVPQRSLPMAGYVGARARIGFTVLGFYDAVGSARSSPFGGGLAARFEDIVSGGADAPNASLALMLDERRFLGQRRSCTVVRAGMPWPVTAREASDAAQFPNGVEPMWQELHCIDYGGRGKPTVLVGTVDVFFPPGRIRDSARIDYYFEVQVLVRGISQHGHVLAEFDGMAGLDAPPNTGYLWFAEAERWRGRVVTCVHPSYNYDFGTDSADKNGIRFLAAVAAGRRIDLTCSGMNATTHYHRFHVDLGKLNSELPDELDLLIEGYQGHRLLARAVNRAPPRLP